MAGVGGGGGGACGSVIIAVCRSVPGARWGGVVGVCVVVSSVVAAQRRGGYTPIRAFPALGPSQRPAKLSTLALHSSSPGQHASHRIASYQTPRGGGTVGRRRKGGDGLGLSSCSKERRARGLHHGAVTKETTAPARC
jgi:hypothetical protein